MPAPNQYETEIPKLRLEQKRIIRHRRVAALVDPVAPARLDDVDYLTVPLSGILFGLLKAVRANAHGLAAAPWPEHGATVATSYSYYVCHYCALCVVDKRVNKLLSF